MGGGGRVHVANFWYWHAHTVNHCHLDENVGRFEVTMKVANVVEKLDRQRNRFHHSKDVRRDQCIVNVPQVPVCT